LLQDFWLLKDHSWHTSWLAEDAAAGAAACATLLQLAVENALQAILPRHTMLEGQRTNGITQKVHEDLYLIFALELAQPQQR
jgi:hypothetical protein